MPPRETVAVSVPARRATALSHLVPALTALLVCALIVGGGVAYARSQEKQYVHALAPVWFPLKQHGSALQRQAFLEPDLLPIYGSSELKTRDPYDASEVFDGYPTGFTVFPVCEMGASALIVVQELAALSSALGAKKLVISLTPPTFFRRMMDPGTYAGNFSPLHASEFTFSTDLSLGVKAAVARQMLEYPGTLHSSPLTEFAVHRLAGNSPSDRLLYYLALPLGKLQNLVLELQDHWETLQVIRSTEDLAKPPGHHTRAINWLGLLAEADRECYRTCNNNPFGFSNKFWRQNGDQISRGHATGDWRRCHELIKAVRSMPDMVARAREWEDLELLLQALEELKAQPLILNAAMCGRFYDYCDVPYDQRRQYYQKLEELAGRYGCPVLDFADFDGDCHFVTDPASHLSSKGWVYYAEAMDHLYQADYAELRGQLGRRLPRGPGPCRASNPRINEGTGGNGD
jgi:D-alanine transfer protein